MIKFILYLSSVIIYFMKKLSGVTITTSGEVPKKGPILFLANHFTRYETLVVPYILFSQHKRVVRSLADDAIFVGWMGEYMKLAGSISNKSKVRDCIIIDDLLAGKLDWIVYPEGHMVKNKLITSNDGKFCVHTPMREGPVYTGAAVLALKSQIIRRFMKNVENDDALKEFCATNKLTSTQLKKVENLKIVPLSITYYPIRPGRNRFMLWIDKYFNLRGTRFFEELEIELNLLMAANMHLHFCEAISVNKYIDGYLQENNLTLHRVKTPIEDLSCSINGSSLEENEVVRKLLNKQRKVLINDVMAQVYGNLQINFDHIFILSLVTMPSLKVCPSYLKTLIYKNIRELRIIKGVNLHPELKHELFKLILDDKYIPFISAIKLAQIQKILYENSEGDYLFDKSLLEKEYDFNKVRVKDTLQVILNEIKWQKELVKIAYHNAEFSEKELREDNFSHLKKAEWDIYVNEYLLYHDTPPTKESVGAPQVYYSAENSVGLVFSHGYMAAPAEAKHLAKYLFSQGINVYLPRLRGHGSSPKALKNIAELDWEIDFERAFTAMRQVCDKVFIGGFSTGGLLALLHAAKYPVDGVIAINSALKLNNLKVSYVVPSLHAFNEMVSYLHAKGIGEWMENHSENPNINYAKHPLESVAEMEKVMTKTDKGLFRITAPILVLQGDNDPVVNPKSAEVIYNRIQSKSKKLVLVPRTNHTIILGEGEIEVFESIKRFIQDTLKSQPTSKYYT